MSLRTSNPRLRALYENLRDYDWDSNYATFKHCRTLLQPTTGRQYAKVGYNDPYCKREEGDQPRVAAGVLAKLISGCYIRKGKATLAAPMRRRLRVVNDLCNAWVGAGDDILASDFSDGELAEKETWMTAALRQKFSDPFYRGLLLATDTGWLVERGGGRDKNSNFAGVGGLLSLCLRATKNEKQQKEDRTTLNNTKK